MSPKLVIIVGFAFFTLLSILLARRQGKTTVWNWALVIVGPLLVVAVVAVVEISRQKAILAPFEPYIADYVKLPGENAGNPALQISWANPTGEGYIRGKVIPVQVRDDSLDILYFDLPEDLRAVSPDEVETIIWLYCVHVTREIRWVGASSSRTIDYSCDVAVIDQSLPAIVAKQSFKETSGEQGDREVLYPNIVAYLSALPRK